MTNISFFHGAADRMQAAARWLQQAWQEHQRVVVYVPDRDLAARLDRLLWTQSALSFLPHCDIDAPIADQTPIILADHLDAPPQENCLLNLSDELPPNFSRFEHLVEIVSTDDPVRLPARERYKFYRDRGYAIESQEIAGGP